MQDSRASKKRYKKVPISLSTDQRNGQRIFPRPKFYKNMRFISHSKLKEINLYNRAVILEARSPSQIKKNN